MGVASDISRRQPHGKRPVLLGLIVFLLFISEMTPSLRCKSCVVDISTRTSLYNSYKIHFDWLCFSEMLSFVTKGSFLDEGVRTYLECSSELYWFSKTMGLGFSRFMTSLVLSR